MDISKHAEIRCQQRGIPKNSIDLILQFGTPLCKPGGVIEYKIYKKNKSQIQAHLKKLIDRLDKIENKAVLISDNQVITVYHKNN
ncbi:hypothetical protein GF406_21395 [candidate division KSB1 bacterium]|nr:hypothetical protein [candidate division KSB1 bacterium]